MADKQTQTRRYDPVAKKYITETVGKTFDSDSSLATKTKYGSTAGRGLGSMGGGFTPPKQNPGESSQAYGERVRKARTAHQQKEAMK